MGFLDNYEDVNARIKRFRAEFKSGRLVAYIESFDIEKGTILVRAEAYREYEDTVPSAVDYAFGNVNTYPQNMRKWMVEDTITSAYGRCIGLLTPSLEHSSRPTMQDMEKVETLPAILFSKNFEILALKNENIPMNDNLTQVMLIDIEKLKEENKLFFSHGSLK